MPLCGPTRSACWMRRSSQPGVATVWASMLRPQGSPCHMRQQVARPQAQPRAWRGWTCMFCWTRKSKVLAHIDIRNLRAACYHSIYHYALGLVPTDVTLPRGFTLLSHRERSEFQIEFAVGVRTSVSLHEASGLADVPMLLRSKPLGASAILFDLVGHVGATEPLANPVTNGGEFSLQHLEHPILGVRVELDIHLRPEVVRQVHQLPPSPHRHQ